MTNMRYRIGAIVFCLLVGTLLEAAWTSKRLTVTPGDSWAAAMALNATGIYVLYHDNTVGNNEIMLNQSPIY